MRAVSSVLDVSVFLLLVSVAILTLTVPAATPAVGTADETAEVLATTTANATYTLAAGGTHADTAERTVAGTHAALLGRAAVSNLTLDETRLAPTAEDFRETAANATTDVLAWSPRRTGVVANWEPYPDAPVRGRVAVGSQPPPGVDVSTATVRVPVPVADVRAEAKRASDEGYRAIASLVASATLETSLPDPQTSTPGGRTVAGAVYRKRLQAYGGALDVSDTRQMDYDDTEAVRAAIRRRLTDRLAADMRNRYDTPAAAAADLRTGWARIVVREWRS